MANRTPEKSAQLSRIARDSAADRETALHRGVQADVIEVRHGPGSEAAAWQRAWDAGKIRWQDIPAKFRG